MAHFLCMQQIDDRMYQFNALILLSIESPVELSTYHKLSLMRTLPFSTNENINYNIIRKNYT